MSTKNPVLALKDCRSAVDRLRGALSKESSERSAAWLEQLEDMELLLDAAFSRLPR